jgi:hypothetical protein
MPERLLGTVYRKGTPKNGIPRKAPGNDVPERAPRNDVPEEAPRNSIDPWRPKLAHFELNEWRKAYF